ncbi:hypothetical protein Tco_1167075 [Tanacetum coccineum]
MLPNGKRRGERKKENPIRWNNWERLCVSKYKGGLGFRHLGLFNKPLLSKQGCDSLSIWIHLWQEFLKLGMSLLELRPSECEFHKVRDLMVDDGSEGTTHENFTVRDAYKKGLANIGLTNNLSDTDTQICSSLHVILNDGFCVYCDDPNEDVLHALFQCDRVRQITRANGRCSNDMLEPLVRSNRIAHGQSPQNCRLIWQGATRLLQEFQDAAMHGNTQTGINVNLLASIWQPSPYGFVKSGGNAVAYSIARWALGDIVVAFIDGLVHLESSLRALADDS